ncbi:protein of unknown function [Daejeonella rubra]|uniref:DUF4249 domain-containing protein n=1 Tax=Daejeonella rubra TaxID=990371 RepID=A0A1G9M7C6_9SPHI|nr:DUF4249 domain-containing protein [Daejeonella rubra]SDL70034.1 protein of unknown function [Daejeonella rubra]
MKRNYITAVFIFVFLLSLACKKPFVHDGITESPSLLVVEGVINTAGQTNIYLSRTLKLADKLKASSETKAKVQVEGQNNVVFPLTENIAGTYSAAQMNLNPNQQYRLRIKTATGKEYLSDLMTVRTTPAIDSVNWEKTAEGVKIYVNAHDNTNNTKYYQWNYEETWEIRSSAYSENIYKDGAMQGRNQNEMLSMYTCYVNDRSTGLLIASTAKLSSDVVHRFPLVTIQNRAEKLDVRYSILTRQYAIGKEAFDYLSIMKKNSEQLGSFFDIQPSEINGNIKCLTDPNELVIGFMTISGIVEKRIFINYTQVPGWNFNMNCTTLTVPNRKDSLDAYFKDGKNLVTISNLGLSGLIESYSGSTANCLDCRLKGSSIKPAFW